MQVARALPSRRREAAPRRVLPRQVRRAQLLWVSIIDLKESRRNKVDRSMQFGKAAKQKRQENDRNNDHEGRKTLQPKKDVELKGKVVDKSDGELLLEFPPK